MSVICIDIKSFYASCECVERGLNPFKTSLVVANKHQGNGAMTLAITPHLKGKGIKSRSRLFEIPTHLDYIIAKPRMSLYEKYSKKVVQVYLEFVSKEDLYIYSIDECFLNLKPYLKMYNKTDTELSKEILETLTKKTGLYASCGIGDNLFLAKTALDIEAKKNKDSIAKWTKDNIENTLWKVYPLREIWGIGKNTEKKLNNLGIFTGFELANYDKSKLNKVLGINGSILHDNMNGITTMTVKSENTRQRDKSISHSKVFLKDLYGKDIYPVVLELIEDLSFQLREKKLLVKTFKFQVNYSRTHGGSFYKTFYFEKGSNDSTLFYNLCKQIFELKYNNKPIRQVILQMSNLIPASSKQLNLFDKETSSLDKEIDTLNKEYGTNIINKAKTFIKK